MTALSLSRFLGWLSVALGTMELVAPVALHRSLGLPGRPWLVRAFGFRELAAGAVVLISPESAIGPATRLGGNAMDIAVLAVALMPANPRRGVASVAMALVLGVTALDLLCTSALAGNERRRRSTAARTLVAPSERRTRA